ncbi:MAG: hypothetical protein AAF318_15870 [Pseudomonadota bacterium]
MTQKLIIPADDEDAAITAAAHQDPDNPPLDDAFWQRARPHAAFNAERSTVSDAVTALRQRATHLDNEAATLRQIADSLETTLPPTTPPKGDTPW